MNKTPFTKAKLIDLIKDMPDDTVILGENYAGCILPVTEIYSSKKEECFNEEIYENCIVIQTNW